MDSGKPFFFHRQNNECCFKLHRLRFETAFKREPGQRQPGRAVLAKECLPNNGRLTRQTDAASGRYRAVVRTGAGVGSLEVRLSSHSNPPDPRESRRPARVARNSGAHRDRLVTA